MELRKFIINLALKMQGIPYIWGGNSPKTGFDCSGFIIWILQVFDVLPSGDWTADGLSKKLKNFDDVKDAFPGDLIFYGKYKITHVMMYIGNSMCIGASGGGPDTLNEQIAAIKGARVKVKRFDYRTDVKSFGRIIDD